MRAAAALAIGLAASLTAAHGDTGDTGGALARLLAGPLGFSAAQVAAVRRGETVVVEVPGAVSHELAVGGAVRVAVPAARMVDVMRDVERLERGRGFLVTRRFSTPPSILDVAALRLPDEDIRDLRACRPGRCEVKLGREAFPWLAQVDWSRPDVGALVDDFVRRMSVGYVEQYRRAGNRALPVYHDAGRPVDVAREFEDMVRLSPPLGGGPPGVASFLLSYPHGRPAGAEDYFYWSLARFGLKPVVRLNHVVVHPTFQATGLQYVITTKQLYASHYFHTALEVRALVDDPERPGRGHYLLVLNRARTDGLTGVFGGVVKLKVGNGARRGLEAVLRGMKARAEAE